MVQRQASRGLTRSVRRARVEARAARGLARAIEVAGSMTALAAALGISRQAIARWPRVPRRHVPGVVAACRGLVTAEQLDPGGEP